MGSAREAVAFFLLGKQRLLQVHTLSHQTLLSALAAGRLYTNAYELVQTSGEQFGDILYNIDSSTKPTKDKISQAEDLRALWERVTGETWPTEENKTSANEPDKDS